MQGRRERMFKKSIPNLITSMNLLCGFVAIIFIFDEKILESVLCIIGAMVLDTMDGRLARMLKVDGDFGKELDSLADVVTFGVAPALLFYNLALTSFDGFGPVLAAVFPVCGALRLARFNTVTHKIPNHFIGLPITASGVILSLFTVNIEFFGLWFIMVIYIILSFLMVSNINFPNFKKIHFPKYFLLILFGTISLLFGASKVLPNQFPLLLLVPVVLIGIILAYKIRKKKKNTLLENEGNNNTIT